MISTEQHPNFWFKYGYFEIKAHLPSFNSGSPAFWLQSPSVGIENNNPSINGTEIDIMEYGKAAGQDSIFQSIIWNGYGANRKAISAHVNVPGVSSGYHTFGLEWTQKEYITFVDGVETARTDSAVSHRPEFLILSMLTGGFAGNPRNPNYIFPDYFNIDYIRIYTRRPQVTLYSRCDYYKWVSSPILAGSYTKSQLQALQVVDNDASSIEVPTGWTATLYNEDNFTGDSLVITSDTRCLSNFDNKVTSIRVRNH